MLEQYGIVNFPAFLLAGIMLNLTPGSDTMYIVARSVSQGRSAGVLSALGISSGAVIHTLFAACGLSVILANSATAFQLVKYAGAIYLIYLGVKFCSDSAPSREIRDGAGSKNVSSREIYFSGVLTNVLNPKVALFFLAFLPQFISVESHDSMVAFLILGITFICTGTIWCLCLACFSSTLSTKLAGNGAGAKLQKITGLVFIAMGLKLAFSKK